MNVRLFGLPINAQYNRARRMMVSLASEPELAKKK